ncbi:MAG: T9SS type A sorting domain-containing protein, partial [Ginsengibacter sp.]
HSSDANNWKSIYTSAPKGSNSNYVTLDNNPVPGNNYYRLLTTDLDGSQRYSDVKSVSFSSSLLPNVYPNPTSGSITIRHIKTGDVIVLTDITGRQMLKKQANAETQMIDIHLLAQGMYFMSVMRDGVKVMNDKITKL